MATTKIWAIKDSIGRVLDYARNPQKTTFSDLKAALHYAGNEGKTVAGEEQTMFVTGVNCAADTAVQEMIAVQERFNKTTGNVAYHAYQSFKPGEVTPELCHQLGVELAKKLWGDAYQVLVATHFNTGTYHNHLVVNAVGMWDGKKFDCSKRAYYRLRQISDELCAEHGLSVIQNPRGKTPRKLYFAEKNGEPTKYSLMREAIDKAITMSTNSRNFCDVMMLLGYEVDLNPYRKYATICSVNSDKPVRLWRLGEGYDRESLEERILANQRYRWIETNANYNEFYRERRTTPPVRYGQAWVKGSFRTVRKITGLRALYLHYCYLLGMLPKKNVRRPLSPEMREAWRKIDRTTAQLTLLSQKHLKDIHAVRRFILNTEQEMRLMADYRKRLYREAAACHDPEQKQALISKRDNCTKAIAVLRREKKTAEGIIADLPAMKENIQIEAYMRQERYAPKKQRTRGYER